MGVVKMLGNYVYDTTYEELPRQVVAALKERFLDYLGTAFDAVKRMPMDPVIRVLKTYGTREEASIIGMDMKLPCSLAALVNSHYSISDGWSFIAQHQAMIVIPAALAIAEVQDRMKPVSGKDLILALEVGYEVMTRVAFAMSPSTIRRGFSSTSIVGPMGAAAAASKILQLDAERTTNALAIASVLGSGFQATDRAPHPLFSFQVGRASESGVLSSLLAQGGLKGGDEILEEGFFPALSDEYNLDLVTQNLGRDHKVMNSYLKLYGGCRALATPIDVALHLRNENGIHWEEIRQVRIRNRARALVMEIENPKTGRQAEYSMAFGVAVALIYGDASLDRFTDAILKSEPVQILMKKIVVEHDPGLDQAPPEIGRAHV